MQISKFQNFKMLDSHYHIHISLPPTTITPPRLKTLQPLRQRSCKIASTHRPRRKRRPKIITMLRALHHVPKNTALPLLLATLGRIRKSPRLRRIELILVRQRRERSPGIKLPTAPVHVGGPDVPAAEDLVCALHVGPFGQEVALCGGELAVADVALVVERVVFGDELVVAEVGGLEEAPLRAVLPGPADARGILESLAEIAVVGVHCLGSGAVGVEEVVYDVLPLRVFRPACYGVVRAFALRPAFCSARFVRRGVGGEIVAEVSEAVWATVDTVALPKTEGRDE